MNKPMSVFQNPNLNVNYDILRLRDYLILKKFSCPVTHSAVARHTSMGIWKNCSLFIFFLFQKRAASAQIPSCFLSPQMFITPCWGGIIPIQVVKHTYK